MDTSAIKETLRTVKFPGFSRDIVSFGLVRDVEADGGEVLVTVAVTTADDTVPEKIAANVKEAVGAMEGVDDVQVKMEISKPERQTASQGQGGQGGGAQLQKVTYAVAIASGKGGVGKSTVAVNLACAIRRQLEAERSDFKGVGIMDCDIYGPSVPLMLGASGQPEIQNEMIVPIENFGVRTMSMGFLIDENTPVVWRGPMVQKTIQQFAQNVDWGALDILVVDLPPGTGDAQLSLVQTLPLDGALIVTTPQAAAYNVARRGAKMFDKVSVPVLGVIENMSYLEGPDGSRQHLFGEGGGEGTASALETSFLGPIPIDQDIRTGGDNGIPMVVSNPESAAAQAFRSAAASLLKSLPPKG